MGDTIKVTKYHGVRNMWLVKNPGLKKYTDKVYVVLGLVSDGWCTLNNGTPWDIAPCEEEDENENWYDGEQW